MIRWGTKCCIGFAQKRTSEDSVLSNRLRVVFSAALPARSGPVQGMVMAKLPTRPRFGVDSTATSTRPSCILGKSSCSRDDGSYEHIAWVPSKEESGKGDLIGLDLDQFGNIYVAYTGHSKHDFRKDWGIRSIPLAGMRR